MDDKLIIRKVRGEDGYKVFSVRVKKELVKSLDEIAEASGYSRNEIVNIFLEYAIQHYIIEEWKDFTSWKVVAWVYKYDTLEMKIIKIIKEARDTWYYCCISRLFFTIIRFSYILYKYRLLLISYMIVSELQVIAWCDHQSWLRLH